jgi:hypothetical protein
MPQADFTEGLHVERHRDGSVRARGPVVDGEPDGHWEWFRLDGTMLRSGCLDRAGRPANGRPATCPVRRNKVTTVKD